MNCFPLINVYYLYQTKVLMPPPLYFVESNGKLSPTLIVFLHKAFHWNLNSLTNTVWKSASSEHLNWIEKCWCRLTRLNRTIQASVKGRTVYYKDSQKSDLEWLYLIVHEQVHRQDIDQFLWFYPSYLLQGIYLPYHQISWEKKAYQVASLHPLNGKDDLSKLIYGKEQRLIEICMSHGTIEEKSNKIIEWFLIKK